MHADQLEPITVQQHSREVRELASFDSYSHPIDSSDRINHPAYKCDIEPVTVQQNSIQLLYGSERLQSPKRHLR